MSILLKFSCINCDGKRGFMMEKLMSILLKFSCINWAGKCGLGMRIDG